MTLRRILQTLFCYPECEMSIAQQIQQLKDLEAELDSATAKLKTFDAEVDAAAAKFADFQKQLGESNITGIEVKTDQ